MKTYANTRCHICKEIISTAGFAKHSHMMAHVRRGEATVQRYRIGNRRYTTYEPTKKTGLL